MKNVIAALALASTLTVGAAFTDLCAATAAPAAENKRDQAIKLYNAKNYKDAIQLFDQHLTVYPSDVYALYYDALACQAMGNMGKAKIYYRQVATLAPTHQLGTYAIAVLQKIDPSFAASLSVGSGSSASSSSGSNSSSGSGSSLNSYVSSSGGTKGGASKLDPTIPYEWDVQCSPGDHGDIWVDVQIDGRTVKMIFDTGAPTVFIGKNQMEEAGIQTPKSAPNSVAGGSSASGTVPAWKLPMKVKLGQVERIVTVQVVETNQSHPLLGQSYAGQFEYTIDAGARRINFKQRGYNNNANRNAYEVPYTFREAGNRVIVTVEVNGKPGQYIFDTGNTASGIQFFSPSQAAKYGVKIPDDAATMVTSGVTGSSTAKSFTVNRAKLGPIDKVDLPVTVSNVDDGELPLLGQPFWQGYEYTINHQKRVIEFVRR